jgi:1-phosphofructokinase
VRASSVHAGGKGINVSTCIAAYGVDNSAGGFLGSENSKVFERHFARCRIGDCFLRVEGENRRNIKIVDAAGTTDLNLKGMPIGAADVERLISMVESFFEIEGVANNGVANNGIANGVVKNDVANNGVAVLAGSLPPGCPSGFYGTLTGRLKAKNCTVLLDTAGAALKDALAVERLPDCIKPNIAELSEWAGEPLGDHRSIVRTARKLIERGLKLAVVSMGAEGALFVDRNGAVHAGGTPERMASTVGAGDAMMAGIAVSLAAGPGLEDLARLSTAFSIAKLESPPEQDEGFRNRLEAALGRIRVTRTDF